MRRACRCRDQVSIENHYMNEIGDNRSEEEQCVPGCRVPDVSKHGGSKHGGSKHGGSKQGALGRTGSMSHPAAVLRRSGDGRIPQRDKEPLMEPRIKNPARVVPAAMAPLLELARI